MNHMCTPTQVIEDVRAPVHVNDPLDQSLSGWEALTITIKWARQVCRPVVVYKHNEE